MKPIGIQLYTLREAAKDDFVGVLKQVAETGYKAVEFAGLHGNKPAEVRKIIDDLGMVSCSMHAAPVDADNLNESVDTAKTLGYDVLITGVGGDDFKTTDSIKAAADRLQASADLLEPHGLRVGYHNHWWEMDLVDGRVGYEILLENAPDLRGELDVYWACNFGAVNVPELLARIASRVPMLHIKDGPLVKGEPHTAVGAGKMDIPTVTRAADDGVLQWLIVELDECATDMTAAVRESVAYLAGEGLGRAGK